MLTARVVPAALRRPFSLYSRISPTPIARSAARDGPSSFPIQRVHIRRPLLSRSRVTGALSILAVTYALAHYLEITIDVEDAHDSAPDDGEWKTVGPHDANHEDQQHVQILMFLPTGFPEPGPRVRYQDSDPEWQEYLKFAKDHERIRNVQVALVKHVRNDFQNNPTWVKNHGDVDLAKGAAFIRVICPRGPPIEYYQPGIALTGNLEVLKTERCLTEVHYRVCSRIYYPSAAFAATWKALSRGVVRTWEQFTSHTSTNAEANTEVKPQPYQHTKQSLSSNLPSPAPTAASPDHPPTDASTAEPSTVTDAMRDVILTTRPDTKGLLPDPVEFRADFTRTNKHQMFNNPIGPPRGTVMLKGIVDLFSARSRVTIDVLAYYDLKQKRFVHAIYNHYV